MHSHHFQKLTGAALLLCFLALCGSGCKPVDPCENTVCIHGACLDDSCICESAYEGVACDTQARLKFIGTDWHNDLLCQGPGSALLARVDAGTFGDASLVIQNVLRQGDLVEALAHQDTLIVPQQVYGSDYISGIGLYSQSTFTLELVHETAAGQIIACVAVFRR
jgi:hypothetical protein